jgi:diguanylate cyclase (GGDEF)-like protein
MRQLVSAVGERLGGVRRWPLWSLPQLLRAYVALLITAWVAISAWAVPQVAPTTEMLILAVLLVACGSASIEVTRKFGEAADTAWRDMLGVWTLPLVLLLPWQLALLVAIPLQLLSQFRVRRSHLHRVLFSMAAVGLASGLASWLFHTVAGPAPVTDTNRITVWIMFGAVAAIVRLAVNLVIVATVVKIHDPSQRWRSLLLDRDQLSMDGVEITAGLAVATICLVNPVLAPLVLPVILFMLGRNAMSVQFRALAYTDSKTGLLSAGAWEREANVVIAEAHRTQSPLAVLMLDMDDFKRVNDTQGHLAGDAILRLIALELSAQLRPTDLIGRFGGDEFAILLPGTTAEDAYEIAERLRHHVAQIPLPTTTEGDLQVTVSVGLVTLPEERVDAIDLLTAADHALYQSKRTGRNRTSRLRLAS